MLAAAAPPASAAAAAAAARALSSAAPCAACGLAAQPAPCPSLPCLQQIAAAPDHFALFSLCVAGQRARRAARPLPSPSLCAAPPCGARSARQFDISLPALEGTYKRLQRVVHPDYFTSAPEALRQASASASSRLNGAYRALRSPSERARYLLRLLGGEDALGEEGGSGGPAPAASRRVSPALLAEVMEAREVVEDAATPPAALARLGERTRAAQAACARDLTAAFQQGPQGLPLARDIAVALGYYDKLLEEVEARQEATRQQQQQQQGGASSAGT
jgi:molecular chaperone HscB